MLAKEELIKALYEGSYERRADESIEVYEEWHICSDLVAIQRLMKAIASSDLIIFSLRKYRGSVFLVCEPSGRHIIRYLWCERNIRKYYPFHTFSPYVEEFFKVTKDFVSKYGPNEIRGPLGPCSADVVMELNTVIKRLRCVINGAEFKDELNQHVRSSNKNYKSLVGYIDSLFKLRSRLLVLRVDFGYKKPEVTKSAREPVDLYDVKRHREKLFREVKNKLIAGAFVGYCWKLEYGLSKSYHYHCIIFLDGSKVREDISLGRMIGELWCEKITSGKGVYYNCNYKKHSYRSCGIGMVSHDDVEMRCNLLKAASYLTKVEFYIRIALDGVGRCFGRGEMPKLGRRLGRPRKITRVGIVI